MFYGRSSAGDGRGTQRKSDRYDQMTKQQELIELKKREIQAKAEAEKHKKEMEMMLKKTAANSSKSSEESPLSIQGNLQLLQQIGFVGQRLSALNLVVGRDTSHNKSSSSDKQSYNDNDDDEEHQTSKKQTYHHHHRTETKKSIIPNVFANDGSFFEQFKRMQEEKKKKEKEEEASKASAKVKEEPVEEVNEYGSKTVVQPTNKPSIKIINASPIPESLPPPNFYHHHNQHAIPPPPPPPRSDRDRDQDNSRHNNRGNMGSSLLVGAPPPPPVKYTGGFPSQAVKQLAQQVASGGEHVEEMARVENQDDPLMWFLYKPNSAEYKRYRELVAQYKNESQNQGGFQDNSSSSIGYKIEKRRNSSSSSSDENYDDDKSKSSSSRHSKKRRSRWGPQGDNSVGVLSPPHLEQQQIVNFGQASSPPPGESSTNGLHTSPAIQLGNPNYLPGLQFGAQLPPGVAPNFSEFMHTPPPPPPPGGPSVPQWGVKEEIPMFSGKSFAPMGIGNFPLMSSMDFHPKPILSKVTRQSPQLLAYAQQAYGTTNLDEEQWKQCEEAYKMNLIFQDIARKKAKDQQLEQTGKFKHEYDSDEDIDDGGTWEHKQRMQEMEKTRNWATDLTVKAKGKHHIGDFLPPEELAKFMEKYKAVKEGRQLDASDYQEFKIAESNVGFKMLQKMGWSDGEGLGSTGQGITAPIEKGHAVSDKQGLGQDKPGDLNEDDDEYTAYRKRMMLAYRFRPNPLNNPRRAYY